MKKLEGTIVLTILLTFASCSSLQSSQDRDLKNWQAKNLEVRNKKPGVAAALNVLPGIGDFYNGNIGLGVVNLLTWPYSILWAPVGGASGADEVNYYATKAYVEELEGNKKKLKGELETALITGQATKEQYHIANQKIENMDLVDFQKKIPLSDILTPSMLMQERVPSSDK